MNYQQETPTPWADEELAHLHGHGLTYEVRSSGLYLHLPGVRDVVPEALIAQMFPRRYKPPRTPREAAKPWFVRSYGGL